MKTQHTPGPWAAAWPDIKAHGGIVAELNTIGERGEADARLIAAAPEFFALVRAWLITDPHGTHSEACRAAITKATGTP